MTASVYAPPPRRFVPESIDAGNWEVLEPLFTDLAQRAIVSVEDFERWILDVSELESVLNAEEARRYIAMSRQTDDPECEKRYLDFSRDVDPRAKAAFDRLDRIYLESPHRAILPPRRFAVFDQIKVCDAEIFREANLPLETEETQSVTQYTQLMGSLTVEVNGKEVPLAKASLELEEPDRERRRSVWTKIAERRYRERDKIEEIFADLLRLRTRMAKNADLPDYRELRFRRFHRFDYGVAECEAFQDAVRGVVVPANCKLNEARRDRLGLETLRPWDLEVNPFESEPLRPFQTEKELCDLTRKLFKAVEPGFEAEFRVLEERGLLDLFSRANKAPGGYQYFLEDIRMPFIFANAAGTHDDVQTLLHEGGHAFHSLACRDESIILYRDPPLEFCEVASMGMEFLGLEQIDRIYPKETADRVRCMHLERTQRLLAWIATVDAFQHWIYTAESEDPQARRTEWLRLRDAYSPDLDWEGVERYREVEWHRQGHIFRSPFYYIEYGIALIGALQIWSQFRRDPEGTVARYRASLALGGSRSLRELFEIAGLRFEFGADLLGELVDEIGEEWEKLQG